MGFADGLFSSTSGFTKGQYLASNDVKTAIQGIDQSTGTKLTNTKLETATVQPTTGQANDTPTSAPDPGTFNIDGYRNGNPQGTSLEAIQPRSLASNDEEQIASMTLRQPSTDGDEDLINAYTRFFLQSVTEGEQEKYQVVETFTGFYTFFYGKRPPIYRYSGLLLSDPNYRWNNDFKFVYENFFRGTSAVELRAEVIMTYDGRVITGFPLSLTMQQDAANDKGMPFAMDVLVIDHTQISYSIDIADLILTKQLELASLRNKINSTKISLQQGASKSVNTSDNVLNGVAAPKSLKIPGAASVLGPISQLSA